MALKNLNDEMAQAVEEERKANDEDICLAERRAANLQTSFDAKLFLIKSRLRVLATYLGVKVQEEEEAH